MQHLKNVNIPNDLKGIFLCAFDGCKSLEEITIPKTVQFLGAQVFYRCSSLKSINIECEIE